MSLAPQTKNALRLALIASAVVSLAACASRPKPAGPVAPSEPAPPSSETNAVPPPAPVGQSVLPGSVQDFATNVGDRIYFDLDQYDVRPDASETLDAQAQWLNRYPAVKVRVEGNADERGTREYNLALGARRASAVREYLSSRGVSASRMSTISYGKERPIAAGTDEASLQQNRNAHTAIVEGAR